MSRLDPIPGCSSVPPALASAWKSRRKPFADHLARSNAEAEAAKGPVPFDLVLAARLQAQREAAQQARREMPFTKLSPSTRTVGRILDITA
jgi:hypothetical protein